MLRSVGAVVAGLVVGMSLNLVLLQLNTALFPLPAGVDMTDPGEMADVVKGMPLAAWILVFGAHLGQAFVGGWVAARLGVSHVMSLALIVGLVSLVAGIANAVMLSAPAWTWIEMPLYPVVAWLAGRMEVARRRR